jgi:hypothetical protein
MADDDPRSRADERRRLLAALELERNQLIRNIETCRIRDIERAFIGVWSLKDIVHHIATWEAELVQALRDLWAGNHPAILDAADPNAGCWDRAQAPADGADFWRVYEALKHERNALLEEIGRFSDEELVDEGAPAGILVSEAAMHDREHWHEIAAHLAGMEGVRHPVAGA